MTNDLLGDLFGGLFGNVKRQPLGRIFISYSSADKLAVRRLDRRLRDDGYETWRDEKAMHVGDTLALEISEALSRAKVVLIVLSKASLQSRWLRYELDIATERMIQGRCRLVPVLIDDVAVPPELTGRIYADMRPGRRGGYKKITDTLDHERSRFAPVIKTSPPSVLSSEAEERRRAYEAMLGGWSSISATGSVLESDDWEGFTLEETDVVGEIALAYSDRPSSLSIQAFEKWKRRVEDLPADDFALLITECPLDANLATQLDMSENLGSAPIGSGGVMVVLYLPRGMEQDEIAESFEAAKGALRAVIAEHSEYSSPVAMTQHALAPVRPRNAVIPVLQAGDKVLHSTFGLGVVLSVAGEQEKSVADVEFASLGLKRLFLAHAPLVHIAGPGAPDGI